MSKRGAQREGKVNADSRRMELEPCGCLEGKVRHPSLGNPCRTSCRLQLIHAAASPSPDLPPTLQPP